MPWSVIAFGVVAACNGGVSGICAPAKINSIVNHLPIHGPRGRSLGNFSLLIAEYFRCADIASIWNMAFVILDPLVKPPCYMEGALFRELR
jgi:hypothetical protein